MILERMPCMRELESNIAQSQATSQFNTKFKRNACSERDATCWHHCFNNVLQAFDSLFNWFMLS